MKKMIGSSLVLIALILGQLSLAHAQSPFYVQDGVGIGNVRAGDTLAAAIAAWGTPDDQDTPSDDGVVIYTWNVHPGEINAAVHPDGRIHSLFADGNSAFHTRSGLVVSQSTMSDVRGRLGEPAKVKMWNDGDQTWFYWSRGINVTFDRSNVIKYVSVYVPE
jgi:hypothetical protein